MNAEKKTGSRTRLYILLAVFVLLIVLVDQTTKQLVVNNMTETTSETQTIIQEGDKPKIIPVWDGVVHLTYIRNDGASFSMLEGGRWLFVALTAVYFVIIGVLLWKKIVHKPAELWTLAAITGGAAGNLIDRIATGKVVDMIQLEFVHFAVFNVADIFVTCGALALLIITLAGMKKKEPSHDADK